MTNTTCKEAAAGVLLPRNVWGISGTIMKDINRSKGETSKIAARREKEEQDAGFQDGREEEAKEEGFNNGSGGVAAEEVLTSSSVEEKPHNAVGGEGYLTSPTSPIAYQ